MRRENPAMACLLASIICHSAVSGAPPTVTTQSDRSILVCLLQAEKVMQEKKAKKGTWGGSLVTVAVVFSGYKVKPLLCYLLSFQSSHVGFIITLHPTNWVKGTNVRWAGAVGCSKGAAACLLRRSLTSPLSRQL